MSYILKKIQKPSFPTYPTIDIPGCTPYEVLVKTYTLKPELILAPSQRIKTHSLNDLKKLELDIMLTQEQHRDLVNHLRALLELPALKLTTEQLSVPYPYMMYKMLHIPWVLSQSAPKTRIEGFTLLQNTTNYAELSIRLHPLCFATKLSCFQYINTINHQEEAQDGDSC